VDRREAGLLADVTLIGQLWREFADLGRLEAHATTRAVAARRKPSGSCNGASARGCLPYGARPPSATPALTRAPASDHKRAVPALRVCRPRDGQTSYARNRASWAAIAFAIWTASEQTIPLATPRSSQHPPGARSDCHEGNRPQPAGPDECKRRRSDGWAGPGRRLHLPASMSESSSSCSCGGPPPQAGLGRPLQPFTKSVGSSPRRPPRSPRRGDQPTCFQGRQVSREPATTMETTSAGSAELVASGFRGEPL